MNRRFSDQQSDDCEIQKKSSALAHHDLLISLVGDLLNVSVDPREPLVTQGLDSMMAAELLEKLQANGFDAPYAALLDNATIGSLASSLRAFESDGPKATPSELSLQPVPLTGPQQLWAQIEQKGWGSWSNISLCLSMPASLIPAAFLPAMVQSLCEANSAMRMVLVPAETGDAPVQQQLVSGFQVAVQMRPVPRIEKEAMRLIEAFEGEEASPFQPSTRALILSSPDESGRHWLCLSMHHLFSDRVSMRSLARQITGMISRGELQHPQAPAIGYFDYALWQNRILGEAEVERNQAKLADLLSGADTSSERPIPHLANEESLDLGSLPTSSTLRPVEGDILSSMAAQLETTLPLFLHSLFSVLVARLTGDSKALSGDADLLLCHVVSNRESDGSLRDLVGCLDTSIPVAVCLTNGETLQSLCAKTRHAFSEAHGYASRVPRGSWFGNEGDAPAGSQPVLFERVPHLNVLYAPAEREEGDSLDIKIHPVRRVQKTRWGLLLRISLPVAGTPGTSSTEPSGITIQAFAEHRPLAILANDCFVRLLRELLSKAQNLVGEVTVLELIEDIIERVSFASAQVRRAAALVPSRSTREAFIWDKLVARQQRWYKHDERRELLRDESNRFVGTEANPFPFTQLDKLKERRFLDELDVPQARLLHVIPKEGMPDSLVELLPSLPASFAIKPVGAGHSFGVTLVRDGNDLTRNGAPFEVRKVAAELTAMAKRGSCVHEGHVFPFNFSSFLIEELVIDEKGFDAPTDYKVFVIGEKLLWLQVHFKADGHTWVAFVDENFELLPQPAWDPQTCWRTHRALVCTEQEMVLSRKPQCLPAIIEHSKRLGSRLKLFVRLDWYADRKHGPLMGEMTTFPHMLQPRSFYSAWANEVVKAAWQDPDGVDPVRDTVELIVDTDRVSEIRESLSSSKSNVPGLQDFLPTLSTEPWEVEACTSWDTVRDYLAGFDLAPWGVAGGDCVAVFLPNGMQLGGLLLATMNRYLALPVAPTLPDSLLIEQLRESEAKALLAIAETNEADRANEIAVAIPGLAVIELAGNNRSDLAALPNRPRTAKPSAITPTRGPDDIVLALRTSGTTGEPKIVHFTLSRLVLGGALISQSIQLSPADLGISMLPLHHVGGISCNLIAPIFTGTPMRFLKAFDPKAFFDGLAGPEGATWCYLVSTMWEMVLEYADSHPELRRIRPWPRLRLIRSAGSELPHQIALELADLFGDRVTIFPTYGMTEAMPMAAPPMGYRLERPGSVGPALPTVSVEIVDASETGKLEPVSEGAVGEVTVKGPTVLCDDAENSKMFTPRGYFRTGDLGKLAPDDSGWLFITGRIKDAINRGGETIAPGEIEAILKNYPGWKDEAVEPALMVFARTHVDLQEDVALAIAPSLCAVDLADLNAWASRHLPSSMLPQTMIRLAELPRSGSGKLLRARFAMEMNALLKPARLGILQVYQLESDGAAPRLIQEFSAPQYRPQPRKPSRLSESGPTLESVLAVLQNYVGDEVELGPDTRLEDAGVNSLAAVELAGHLSRRFSTSLPPWIISDYPTPRALLSQLSSVPKEALRPARESQGVPELVRADWSLETDQDDPSWADLEPETRILLRNSGLSIGVFTQLISATSWWKGKRSRPESLVFGRNTESTRAPLFYCPATSADFDQMATSLGSDQPVYGMRSNHGVMERTHPNLETLARYYVGEILSIQAEGPYLIAGYCRGVKLAFQIALELSRRGKRVPGLFLLEQVIPIWFPGRITVFFGEDTYFNPWVSFERPEEGLDLFFPGNLAVKTIPGGHDAFWRKPGVNDFFTQLRRGIDEAATASTQMAEVPERRPLLPADAHQAEIETTKLLFITPGEKTLRIKVRITNTSSVVWPSRKGTGPELGYWIQAEQMISPMFHGLGEGLPKAVAPGESVVMSLELQLPTRGRRYRVIIDLVDNRSEWFQFRGSPVATVKLFSHPVFVPFTWMRRIGRLMNR